MKGRRLIGWLRQPPGRAIIGITALFSLLTAWSVSVPGAYFFLLLATSFGWVVLATIGGVRLILALTGRGTRADVRRGWKRWSIMPLVAVLTVAAVRTSTPLRIRYRLSSGAMTEYARMVATRSQDVPAGTSVVLEDTPDRLGLFPVERADRFKGGMRFVVASSGLNDEVGFAYSPSGPPPHIGEDSYRHFSGPWYIWEESF